MRVSYVLENIPTGWLSYEIDALDDLGLPVDIHPNNPAVYDTFEGVRGYTKKRFAGDMAAAGLVWLGRPRTAWMIGRWMVPYAGYRITLASMALALRIEKERPAIIHAHFATAPASAAWAASRLSGIPFGFTAHAYDIFKEPIDRDFLARKCEDAAFVRCISEYNRRHLMKITGVDEKRFHVIHCGVDTRRFAPSERTTEKKTTGKIILAVGNFVEQKGYAYLIRAMSAPSLKQMGCRLVIAGDGPLRAELIVLADSLGVKAEFPGAVDNRRIMEYYRAADIFALPCVTGKDGHHDGIPVVLMEAMACGLPVLSTRLSGIPELICDGENGMLVPEGDEAMLAEAIGRLIRDDGLRGRFSIEGRKTVIAKFEIRDVARSLVELFSAYA